MSVWRILSDSGNGIPTFTELTNYPFVIGLPFMAAVVVIFYGRVWMYKRIKRIHYAVTDRKFIIMEGDKVHSFTSNQMLRMAGETKSINHSLYETSADLNEDYVYRA